MVFEEAVSLSCDKYYKANWLFELCWHISMSALEEKLFPLSDFSSSYPLLQEYSWIIYECDIFWNLARKR